MRRLGLYELRGFSKAHFRAAWLPVALVAFVRPWCLRSPTP